MKLAYGDVLEYEDGHYYFERYLKSKHPQTGDWYEAVLYQCTENGVYYVRERKDFEAKFSLVPQEKPEEAEAHPLFDESGHRCWGANCTQCGSYYESTDTRKDFVVTCRSCDKNFKIRYPGDAK